MVMTSRSFLGLACAAGLLWFAATAPTPSSAQQADGDRVVLITIDGARTEEIFGGLDLNVLKSTLKVGQSLEADPTYKRFWAGTAEERRAKILPFFWGTLMARHGSIAGHRARESAVRLTNKHWFSYPGYAEILVGEAHDDVIKSNDPIRNPYPTVLEVLREKLALGSDQVATFGSWGVFNEIAEHTAGATTVDAGPDEPLPSDPVMRELRALQAETLPPWSNVRSDIFTIRSAMAHFEKARPRVVYIALDETDDWAHDGRYDRLLDAYVRTDRYLEQLWTWLQNHPDYRGRTHLLITTDHGRGHTPADWRDHGAKIVGADEVWIAFASPRMADRGEWRSHPPITTSQIAATLAGWMGVDWRVVRPSAGAPIERANVRSR
jgi:hypothetical protein